MKQRAPSAEVQIESVELDQGQPTICGGRGHRDGATNPSASPGKTHLSNRVGRSPRPHRVGVARLQQIAKILAARPAEPLTMRLLTEKQGVHAVTIANAYQTQDSIEDTECGLLRVPLDIIDQRLACLIATARLTGVTPAFFFPSPNLTSHRQPPSSN